MAIVSIGSQTRSGTWTPSFVNLTVVLGGGAVAYSGQWTANGNVVDWSVLVDVSGGATTESAFGTTFITNFPFQIAGIDGICTAINAGSGANYGDGQCASGSDNIFTPTWAATSSDVIITGRCFI